MASPILDQPHAFFGVALVLPGYKALYGQDATIEKLLATLRKFAVIDWLSYLSRLQTILAPPRQYSDEVIAQCYRGVVGNRTSKALHALQQQSPKGVRLGLFFERQISTLQQLVIRHAPETAERRFSESADYDILCDALFMTWDLMCAGRDAVDEVGILTSLLQDLARTEGESPERMITRGFHYYGFHKSVVRPEAERLLDLFQQATGVDAREYLLGGLIAAIHERTKGAAELAQQWESLPDPEQSTNPEEGRLLRAYYKVRAGSLPTIRNEIAKWDGDRMIGDCSLIGVATYPVVELPNRLKFVLNLSDLALSLFDGIRHAIIRHASDNMSDDLNPQALGREFGALWEEYVDEHLTAAVGDRLIVLPEVDGQKRADRLIVYPDRVVILELKSGLFLTKTHTRRLSLTERIGEFKKVDVPKAAEQLRATVQALRRGEIEDARLPQYDWTITPIVPVIFSVAPMPLIWGIRKEMSDLLAPLHGLGGAGPVDPVRFLGPVDIEYLPDLVQVADFGRLLSGWAHDPVASERPFASYLQSEQVAPAPNCFRQRYAVAMKSMASELKLDLSKLDF